MEHLDIELAHRLVGGHLSPSARDRWLRHAERCARCQALLAQERTLQAVLDLSSVATPSPQASVDRLLERVEPLVPGSDRRRWRRRAWITVGLSLAVALTVLLAGQLRQRWSLAARLARELQITPAMQDEIVANLDVLATLRDSPDIVEQYDVLQSLQQLILGPSAP